MIQQENGNDAPSDSPEPTVQEPLKHTQLSFRCVEFLPQDDGNAQARYLIINFTGEKQRMFNQLVTEKKVLENTSSLAP